MKVSFIIAIYNVEQYIEKCVKSVLNQKYKEIEVILIDDGSTDESGNICDALKKADGRIQVVHQMNRGVSVARNEGIKMAKGEWLCFVDGDDVVSPYLVEMYLPYLNNEYDVCFIKHKETLNGDMSNICFAREIKEQMKFEKEDFVEFQKATFNRDIKGRYDYHLIKLATPCKLYRRSFIVENKITFPEGIPSGEDSVFNLQVYQNARRGIYIDSCVYFHRIWGNSVSQKYTYEIEKDFSKLHDVLEKWILTTESPKDYYQALLQRKMWSLGFCCILKYCHPENPSNYNERKKEFYSVIENDYKEVVEKVKLDDFRIEKKVLFYFIKKKNFKAIEILCYLKRKIYLECFKKGY